jgi:hypothetical protein
MFELSLQSKKGYRFWLPSFVFLLAAFTGLVGSANVARAAGTEQVESTDPWGLLRLLEGTWEGAIEGRLGSGKGLRRFSFILDGKFVLVRHASVRLPQEKSPEGDYHRELGVFSFDRERNTLVSREFLVESYVNRYTCNVEPRRLLCATESVENGPGMRARYTLEISDGYRHNETFELAGPGEELQVYFTNRWTRTPDLGPR